jgi:hypothetical protein
MCVFCEHTPKFHEKPLLKKGTGEKGEIRGKRRTQNKKAE